MSDNAAILDGYTREVIASCIEHDLYLLVKPDADLSGTFKAWDTDNQEFIRVNGWLYSISASDTCDDCGGTLSDGGCICDPLNDNLPCEACGCNDGTCQHSI